MRKNKKGGFTLVELVIVIAVIAILAAVLIPTFITVIDSANNSADVQLVANMNSVLVTDIDADSTATAENLRKLLKDNGLDNIVTKKSDNIIVYDQAKNRFKLVNLSKAKVVSEADAKSGAANSSVAEISLDDDTVVSDESRLVVAENPFSPDEIFKGYIVVSTGGNSFAENLYALHDSAVLGGALGGEVKNRMKALWNSGIDGIKESLKILIGVNGSDDYFGTTAFVCKDPKTGNNQLRKFSIILDKKSNEFNALNEEKDCKAIDKILICEDVTELDLNKFDGFGATVIIPNTVEKVLQTEEKTLNLQKVYFVGNTEALIEYAKGKIDPKDPAKDTVEKVLGTTPGPKTINDIKEGIAKIGPLLHETEYYVVNNDTYSALTDKARYYIDINKALEDAGSSAWYSGLPREVILASNYTIDQDEVIVPASVTLQVPYFYGNNRFYTGIGYGSTYGDGTDFMGTIAGNGEQYPVFAAEYYLADKKEGTYKKYELAIANGKTLKIAKGGVVQVGGVLSYNNQVLIKYQGHTSGYYGQISNEGQIIVENGGKLNVYGYIKGNGIVTAENGAEVSEPLIVTDSYSFDMALLYLQSASPFTRYSVLNIQNTFIVKYGAIVNLCATFTVTDNAKADILLIGNKDLESDNKGLISMQTEESSIVMSYDKTKTVTDSDEPLNNLPGDIGKTTFTINGEANTESITINITSPIDTKGALFPIPYNFEYIINGTFNVKNKFAVLPGAIVRVEESGTLNITEGSEFYVADYLYQEAMFLSTACKFKYPTEAQLTKGHYSASGVLIVNGTMKVGENSKVGGIVRAEHAGAKLEIASNVNVDGKYSIGGAGMGSYNLSTYNCPLRICLNSTLTQVEAGKTYTSLGSEQTVTATGEISYARIYNKDSDSDKVDEQITFEETIKKVPALSELGYWTNSFVMDTKSYSVNVTTHSWQEVAE